MGHAASNSQQNWSPVAIAQQKISCYNIATVDGVQVKTQVAVSASCSAAATAAPAPSKHTKSM
jgi:hypothetical protein